MRPVGWKRLLLAVRIAAIALLTGCGNPRPPEPPSLELPQAVRDLQATRKADKVYLTWTIPQRTTEAESILYYGPTRICRSLDPVLKQCGAPVGEAPAPSATQRQAVRAGTTPKENYVEVLPANLSAPATAEFTYAIEALNQAGRSAGLSNQVHVPAAPTLSPPADFRAELTPDAVRLSWAEVPSPPATPGIQYEIRIYRRSVKTGQVTLLASIPIDAKQFFDQTFEWEKPYSYHVTIATEVQLTTAPCAAESSLKSCKATAYVEGEDSPVVQIFAHDIFPPPLPTGLQAVFSGPGQKPFIDLIWNPSAASDLAGYNVYRREGNGAWMKINSELVKAPAYRDPKVEPGNQYTYSVTAIDVRGNESARSEEAGESVPAP